MLRQLHIMNLAVIEDATIDLGPGLNCFTGQTGAGKSLIIGAFELLLGLRSATDLLRQDADEGRVSGVFELTDAETIRRVSELADTPLDVDTPGGEQVLITRKLFASGRTSVSINGQPATAGMLRAIGELLVDVHGQHDHQFLLKPANQLLMLDRFAESETIRSEFASTARALRELERRRDELTTSRSLRKQQIELYEFQAEEIDTVEPTEGEYAELDARHKLLSNLENVQRDATDAHNALYESEGSAAERLQAIVGMLRELAELDPELKPVAESVATAAAQVHDASYDLGRYLNRLDLDPTELGEVTDRLNALNRLIHKYGTSTPRAGGTLDDVLAFRQYVADELTRLRGEGEDLDAIDVRIDPLRTELAEIGHKLSDKRRKAAKKLCPLVIAQLRDLGMEQAKFDVAFAPLDDDSAGDSMTGLDAIEMMVQPNPGQPARPLRKIASGGEMSRVMLAVKSILAEADRISVLVFDEIDANIGGRMGAVIGEKLVRLAAGHQVLCITHLPQIAAWADTHLKISKSVVDGQTRTRVDALGERDGRIDELAEMLSGKHATDTTRRQSSELLKIAEASRAVADARETVAPKGESGAAKRPRKRSSGRKSKPKPKKRVATGD